MTRKTIGIGSFGLLSAALLVGACSPAASEEGSGGARGMGTGGLSNGTGGSGRGTGGRDQGSGGAATATGGASSGGVSGTGGASATGGASTGGQTASGGQAASGGSVGSSGGNAGNIGTGGGGGAPASTGGMAAGGARVPPISDYGAMGPFPATMETKTGPGGKYVIYRPTTLGQNGFLHPPITFGPGISDEPDDSRLKGLLGIIASHGFVIIGTRLDGGPGAEANNKAMMDGLTWILQQNEMPGPYQGKLDVKHAIAMGYSVGGTSAVAIAAHEAIVTTVSIHGHKASSNMHGPLLQTSATGDTMGLPLQKETFQLSKVQTFLGVIQGGSHAYPMQNNGGAERPAIIAWLRYWVYGDPGGKSYFYGDDCTMCKAPNWTTMFQRKNWQ